MTMRSTEALLFDIKADKFIKLVGHHLNFLKEAGGYEQLRTRDTTDAHAEREPSKNAVEVADALVFNLLHGIELALKAELIHQTVDFPPIHKLSELIGELKKADASSPLLPAIDKCVASMLGLEGPMSGAVSADAVSLKRTQLDNWYEDKRYPERRNGPTYSDPFQFQLTSNEQWQAVADAIEFLQSVRDAQFEAHKKA